ncbi:MAG: formate/nitrite transporter family protein [Albidovulum sp.]
MTDARKETKIRHKETVEDEEGAMQDAAKLSPRMIYEVIRRDGEEELERPNASLVWSGIAAGIMISLSVLGEAIFRTHLPDTAARFLVENLGYSLGFLVVILGRMQLFTENTITTVLPLMVKPRAEMFVSVARLWGIVLGANVAGAFAVTAVFAHTSAIPANLLPAILALSEHATDMSAGEGFMRAIPAGVLVAAIVWMLPQAEDAAFFVVLVFTWLIAAGEFSHVVAGSVEMAFMILTDHLGLYDAIVGFFAPVLAGNVVGGTVIFTMLAWGQVKEEV